MKSTLTLLLLVNLSRQVRFNANQAEFAEQDSTQQINKGHLEIRPHQRIQLKKVRTSATNLASKNQAYKNAQTRTIVNAQGDKCGVINLTNNNNYNYIGTLYVGNPPQLVRPVYDTGSANLWVLSSEDTATVALGENYYFSPDQSSTFQATQYQESIQFGSGSLSGYFGFDDLRIGEGDKEIIVHGGTVGVVTSSQVFDSEYDSIVGLAYPSMAEYGTPLMDKMIENDVLPRNVFAFYMAMNDVEESELVFGIIDESRFTGEIRWHDVRDKLFWSLRLTDIKYKGVSLGLCQDRKCLITPDSGTSLLTVPSWAFGKINEALPYDEGCESKFDFGHLTYVIDDVEYSLPSHHFMERYTNVFEEGDAVCSNTIATLDILQEGQENLFIVGDAFMQIFYTIFDRDNDKVGFALAKNQHSEVAEDLDCKDNEGICQMINTKK